jgi:thiamine-monophosphate kinase
MLVDRTDVPLGMSLRQAGRKAIVMNVSDFAAKGATPLAAMVSLGLPRNVRKTDVKQIGLGINQGAREHGIYVVGGDTNLTDNLVVSCFLFGTADPNLLVRRAGARVGDRVYVSGSFGHQAAGLMVLLGRGRAIGNRRTRLIRAVLWPRARLKLGIELARKRVATSCIDSSDGLAWSLYEIAHASKVGITITRMPTSPLAIRFARTNKTIVEDLVLYGGEEYELVFTSRPKKLRRLSRALRRNVIEIGRVTNEHGKVRFENGAVISPRGWDHFLG